MGRQTAFVGTLVHPGGGSLVTPIIRATRIGFGSDWRAFGPRDQTRRSAVTIRDWMSPDPVSVSPDTTVAEARELLEAQGFRHLLVVSDDKLVGIISDRDVAISAAALRAALKHHDVGSLLDDDRPVESVMSGSPHVIGPEAEIREAARLLVSRHINALPVVDIDGSVIGIITSVDCLLATLEQPADA